MKKILEIKREKPNEFIYVHLGIDDTDSPFGMCTTYLGARLVEFLWNKVSFIDYPNLIRLNPNIPWKTRGNAAIALRFSISFSEFKNIKRSIVEFISNSAHNFFRNTNPAVVLFYSSNKNLPDQFKSIYYKAVRDLFSVDSVLSQLRKINFGILEIYAYKEKSRGIIGASAAIGADLLDYTYEILVYRLPKNLSSKRRVYSEDVLEMDRLLDFLSYDNVYKSRILITPHGPDPVLFGIRGDFPEPLLAGFNLIRHESFDRWCLFKTNQGTNVHILDIDHIRVASPYLTVRITGKLTLDPIKQDGKVIIYLKDRKGNRFRAVFFHPTGDLKMMAAKLRKGDLVSLVGSVAPTSEDNITLNSEEFFTLSIMPEIILGNPICPSCGKKMKSKGKDAFFCPKCKFTIKNKRKLITLKNRIFPKENIRYTTPPSAHRHLTLPKERIFFRLLKVSRVIKPYLLVPFWGKTKVHPLELVRAPLL